MDIWKNQSMIALQTTLLKSKVDVEIALELCPTSSPGLEDMIGYQLFSQSS
jgi:hypothetical protein